MTEPTNIKPFPLGEGRSLVQVFTELLMKAQRGEITSVACAIVYADGDCGYVVPPHEGFYKLLGSVEGMKHDMLKAHQP